MKNSCQEYESHFKAIDTYEEEVSKAHGRIEQRTVRTYPFAAFNKEEWGDSLSCLAVVTRDRQKFDSKSKCYKRHVEIAYFVSTIEMSAEDFCKVIRMHWRIENQCHYVRDVTLGEDLSRIRACPEVIATIRSFALNIFRANKVENISSEVYKNAISPGILDGYRYI